MRPQGNVRLLVETLVTYIRPNLKYENRHEGN